MVSNIVKCGNGVATRRQAELIEILDNELAFTYDGRTVKEASDYIRSSLYILELEHGSSMDAFHDSGENWGNK